MELATRLFSWWRRRLPRARFAAEPFTREAVAAAPTARGIYQLYRHGELIYAGLAPRGIRRELEQHRRGAYGDCTRQASGFLCEVAPDPDEALRQYLRTYMAANGGRLPPCNKVKSRREAF